jgi:hypothetical protein
VLGTRSLIAIGGPLAVPRHPRTDVILKAEPRLRSPDQLLLQICRKLVLRIVAKAPKSFSEKHGPKKERTMAHIGLRRRRCRLPQAFSALTR